MVAKRQFTSFLQPSQYRLSLRPDYFVPALAAIPLGFLIATFVQGNVLLYIVSLVGLGILTSLDLRSGPLKNALGFLVAMLSLVFWFEASPVGNTLALNVYPALVLAALPPSIGVVLCSALFSTKTRRRMLKENILASAATGTGLALAYSISDPSQLVSLDFSIDAVFFRTLVFVPLAVAANAGQMLILHYLGKYSQGKRVSFAMMPALFFSINSMSILAYILSRDPSLAYSFLTSLAFVPTIAAIGVFGQRIGHSSSNSSTVQVKAPVAESPTITIDGDRNLKQGQLESIRIGTNSSGQPRDVGSVKATILFPSGKKEQLKVSRKNTGRYIATYSPTAPGQYSIQVEASVKNGQSSRGNFSFNVQSPPPPQPPTPKKAPPPPPPLRRFVLPIRPKPPQPSPQSRPAPSPTAPPPSPLSRLIPTFTRPAPQPAPRPLSGASPALDSWDPKLWIDQDVHGYHVREHVATGAMGYVMRATFGQAGSEMALKIPILRTTTGPTALNDTISEATTLLELSGQSKYVVQIKGILVDRLNVQEIIKGDTSLYLHNPPAIVMEFMRGGNAKRLVEESAYDSLSYSEKWPLVVAQIGQMISTALETIHAANFVHLDVKPQNILFNIKPPTTGQDMLDQIVSGQVLPKLADLGSAVRTGGKVVQFTPEYAPVEQVLGSGADPSMDIYALGATLYSLLTKTAVHSKAMIDAMNNVISSQDPARASDGLRSLWKSFNPDFSRVDSKASWVTDMLGRMLSKEPKKRPSAREVSNSLRNLISKNG